MTTVVFLAALGAALLGLRQHRLTLRHEMTEMHGRLNAERKALWDAQVRIVEGTSPAALREAIARAGLKLEPITLGPAPDETPPTQADAEPTGPRLVRTDERDERHPRGR